MNNRLSDKVTIVVLAGILATSFVRAQLAEAVGNAENTMQTLQIEVQASNQPQEEINQLEVQMIERQKLKEEYEAKVKEERAVFLKMVKEKDIKSINLHTPSGLTADEIEEVLKNTKLAGLGEAFFDAEKNYKINAYYLIAHAAWESGWGTSRLAIKKNNLFGFSAYDSSAYGSASSFKTKSECIDTVAKFISEHYLSEDGDHYNGPNLKGMNKKYASDKNWAQGIANTIECLTEKIQTL